MTQGFASNVMRSLIGEMQAAALQSVQMMGSPVVAFVAGGPDAAPWVLPVHFPDIRDRLRMLRDASDQSQSDVFSFAYDGWIQGGDLQSDALLMVAGTRWADGVSVAVPYKHDEARLLVGDPIDGPPDILSHYLYAVFGDRLVKQ